MVKSDEMVKETLKTYSGRFYEKYLRHTVISEWEEIVGKVNATKIKPLKIEYDKLYVSVNDSSWKTNLYAYKELFMEKINEYVGKALISDIVLGRMGERAQETVNEEEAESEEETITKELKRIPITESEYESIKKTCERYDEDWRELMIKVSVSRLRVEKYRLSKKWHKCEKCSSLCEQKEKLCENCRRKQKEKFREKVAKLLYDVPSSTYAEVRNEIKRTMPEMLKECIPETVESIRVTLIQRVAGSLDLKDKKKVALLVMLYTRKPAEQLTQQLINKVLYKLRYDLPTKCREKAEA